jgi:hypothetical protein
MRQVPPQPLHDYSFIGDGERGAVVDQDGNHVWLCSPGWAGDPVFGALIGGDGVFQVTPARSHRLNTGSYEPGTLIWRHQWVTTAGEVTCHDALALPADPRRVVVLRRLHAARGVHWMHVVVSTGTSTGRPALHGHSVADGVWTAAAGDLRLRLQGLTHARVIDNDIVGDVYVGDGDVHDLVLEIGPIDGPPPDPEQCWRRTREAWAADAPAGAADLPRDVRHAHAVIRGLTSSEGGTVAAATTSLPERSEAGRNYDYRYVWLRDLAMVGQALAAEGGSPRLLSGCLDFVTGAVLADGADLRPTYTTDGGRVPRPRELDLPGYPGAADQVGNVAGGQFQLDVFGECLLLYAAAGRVGPLPSDAWKAVELAVGAIADRADEPDAGIWEIECRRWTHSRLMCAAGLSAVARLAPPNDRRDWEVLAERLLADAPVHDGHWVRADDDRRTDAALLLPVVRGVVPADDPRAVATVRHVLAELSDGHDVYRFRRDDGPLSETEGAFLLCGFAAAMALDAVAEGTGDRVEAARWYEHTRGLTGPAGLFTEEVDPASRQLRGNLPQTFVHAALIESSGRLFRRG